MNTPNTRSPRIKKAFAAGLLLLLAAALAFVYVTFSEQGVAGRKDLSIEVIGSGGESRVYTVRTDALYLLGAMEDAAGLSFAGTDGPYGMMITEINGETADYNVNGAYWSFTVNGEYCNYGVSEQPVEEGDAFVIAYTK